MKKEDGGERLVLEAGPGLLELAAARLAGEVLSLACRTLSLHHRYAGEPVKHTIDYNNFFSLYFSVCFI